MRQQTNLKRWKHSVSMDKGGWQKRYLVYQKNVGEYVTARKFQNMAKEMLLKASLYKCIGYQFANQKSDQIVKGAIN